VLVVVLGVGLEREVARPSIRDPRSLSAMHPIAGRVLLVILVAVAVAAIVVGALLPTLLEPTLRARVAKKLTLDPTASSFVNGSTPFDLYLFNYTNLYAHLTDDATLLAVDELPPLRLVQSTWKYNISVSSDGGLVRYKQLTTYSWRSSPGDAVTPGTVSNDSIVIAPNAFFLSAGANGARRAAFRQTGLRTVDFGRGPDGAWLREDELLGLVMGDQVMASVVAQLLRPTSQLMQPVRFFAMGFYVTWAQQVAANSDLAWTDCLVGWANGTSRLSTGAPQWFTGFELPRPLASVDPFAVAQAVFGTGAYGLRSQTGLGQWQQWLLAARAAAAQPQLLSNLTMEATGALGCTPSDVPLIGQWVASLGGATNLTSPSAMAYEAAVCAFLGATMHQYAHGFTTFAQLYAQESDFAVHSWTDVATLQFGTAYPVGLASDPFGLLLTGIGGSLASMPVPPSQQAAVPLAFRRLAPGEPAEPLEFPLALAFQWQHMETDAAAGRLTPAQARVHELYHNDSSLLFAFESSGYTTPRVLTQVQARALMATLARPGGFQALWQRTHTLLVDVYAPAVAQSSNQTLAFAAGRAALEAALAPDTRLAIDVETRLAVDTALAVRVYLAYVADQLAGRWSQLDRSTGVAPHNDGLWTRRTVREWLFGYTNRLGIAVPGLAGTYLDPAAPDFDRQLTTLMATDGLGKAPTGQWTGANDDLARVGAYETINGFTHYTTACQLTSGHPERCRDDGQSGDGDWPVWGLPGERIVDASDGLYTSPIDLERYELDSAITHGPSPWKDQATYHQDDRNAPDGWVDIRRPLGGLPLAVSPPHQAPPAGATWVTGASPYDAALHATHLDVEPLTGRTFRGAKRLQVSVRVHPDEWTGAASITGHYEHALGAPSGATDPAASRLLPWYWSDVHKEASDGDQQTFREARAQLQEAQRTIAIVRWALVAFGIVCFAWLGVAWWLHARRKRARVLDQAVQAANADPALCMEAEPALTL
jgi:hypothetical protein